MSSFRQIRKKIQRALFQKPHNSLVTLQSQQRFASILTTSPSPPGRLHSVVYSMASVLVPPVQYKEFPELGSPKEIIQNEYLAILYEQGICGAVVLLLSAVLLVLIYKQYNKKHEKSAIYGRVLILSFALTLCFFSGLPNALHIYLLPILFF